MAIPEDFAERIMFRANMLRNLREAKAPECISKPLEEMFKESLNPIVFILTMAATLLKEREINQEKFKQLVKKITGIQLDELNTGMFKRDGILVPFIEYVNIPINQTEQYIKYRLLRERIKKINNLKFRK